MTFGQVQNGGLFSAFGREFMKIEECKTVGGVKNVVDLKDGKLWCMSPEYVVESSTVALVNVGQE